MKTTTIFSNAVIIYYFTLLIAFCLIPFRAIALDYSEPQLIDLLPGDSIIRLNDSGNLLLLSGYELSIFEDGVVSSIATFPSANSDHQINNNKQVVWRALSIEETISPYPDYYIYLYNGGAVKLISDSSTENGHPTLNNLGQAAWVSGQYGNNLYFYSGSSTTNITASLESQYAAGLPKLTENGTVYWINENRNQIIKYENGTINTISPGIGYIIDFAVNDMGNMVISGYPVFGGGVWEVYHYHSGSLDTIYQTTFSLEVKRRIEDLRINNSNQISWSVRIHGEDADIYFYDGELSHIGRRHSTLRGQLTQLNELGQIAWVGFSLDNTEDETIYLFDGGVVKKITDNDQYIGGNSIYLNNQGLLIYKSTIESFSGNYVVSPFNNCTFTMTSSNSSFDFTGGSGSLEFTASDDCTWEAIVSDDWVNINQGISGYGSGLIEFEVETNTNTESRTATITLHNAVYTIYQSPGSDCIPTLEPTHQNFYAEGGLGTIGISIADICTWEASGENSWITIESGKSGQGYGTIMYRVSENDTIYGRGAAILVNGIMHSIQQDTSTGCTLRLAPGALSFTADGGSGTVDIITEEHCNWQASCSSDWIEFEVSQILYGLGNGQLEYKVKPNLSTSTRTAIIDVEGRIHTIRQHSPAPNHGFSLPGSTLLLLNGE
ncbi:MAG: BACON domain-containing carbohydrate-binding protein [Desulfopila sp.]|jgi:hypothetical protein|nr:BACON domain-containing carbohydrate-binding protein [Desulfopila sp.]